MENGPCSSSNAPQPPNLLVPVDGGIAVMAEIPHTISRTIPISFPTPAANSSQDV